MKRNRRRFLQGSAAAIASALAPIDNAEAYGNQSRQKIPRWRGFNLTELASGERHQRYEESDFAWMADWDFNFARLPCSYWAWSTKENWMTINEAALQPLDRAVSLGRRYGIHVNLCLHRIPGYCVNAGSLEPDRLFDSTSESMERALVAAAFHWEFLPKRYKDIPIDQLSCDLLNEPPFKTYRLNICWILITRWLVMFSFAATKLPTGMLLRSWLKMPECAGFMPGYWSMQALSKGYPPF